jgi:hypothetical protein
MEFWNGTRWISPNTQTIRTQLVRPIETTIGDSSQIQEVQSIHSIKQPSVQHLNAALNFTSKLPVELVWRCIMEALPLDANYASQLLDLTSVSRSWNKQLLEAPIFWTQIYIEWSQPDLMAMVEAFLQLSSGRVINLII